MSDKGGGGDHGHGGPLEKVLPWFYTFLLAIATLVIFQWATGTGRFAPGGPGFDFFNSAGLNNSQQDYPPRAQGRGQNRQPRYVEGRAYTQVPRGVRPPARGCVAVPQRRPDGGLDWFQRC